MTKKPTIHTGKKRNNPNYYGSPAPNKGGKPTIRQPQVNLTDYFNLAPQNITPYKFDMTGMYPQHIGGGNSLSSIWTKLENLERVISPQQIQKGLLQISQKNSSIRPGFASSWVMPHPPTNAEMIKQYKVEDATISLYLLPGGVEAVYHITPKDYAIPEMHMRLIEMTRNELISHYPHSMELSQPERAKEYVKKFGRKYIYRLAKKYRVPLGNTRKEELKQLQRLSEILAKYTAGMGIIETMLKDENVQDIYVDSPTSANKVYIVLDSKVDKRLSGKCVANLILSRNDTESLLSRFRYESGRPFSEANPLLECSIGEHNTRVSVIGKPLSPSGTAFALRRHATEPWSLLKLIYLDSITPLLAGFISFLIDGKATILIAGSRGAGKTSLLSACMLEFPRSQRIVTIEDTLELPVKKLQMLDYKVQPMQIQSSLGGFTEMSAKDALKIALRLGESALILGEVRGEETKTLYEAMRAGTAGSSVLGTFHANSAEAVFERIVYDMNISARSFAATDMVIVTNYIRPKGTHKMLRRVTQVGELDKEKVDGTFHNLFVFDEERKNILETDVFHKNSAVIARIAASWGMSRGEAIQNIITRATIRKIAVDYATKQNRMELLSAEWVEKINSKFWELLDGQFISSGRINYQILIKDFSDWFARSAAYA